MLFPSTWNYAQFHFSKFENDLPASSCTTLWDIEYLLRQTPLFLEVRFKAHFFMRELKLESKYVY